MKASPVTGDPFVVELQQFNGPLDLLLSLIRDEQVDISDIPIARIAQQFLGRISSMGIDQAAEYLEMAARLLRIKAQMLLPRNQDDENWEDPRAELVRRLLEYQQVREVSDRLAGLAEERRSRFARAWLPNQSVEPPPAPLALSLGELLGAVDRVLRVAREPHIHDVVPRPLDVDGAIATIRTLLAARAHARWYDVIRPSAESWEVLSALLALLELARRGELRLRQATPFGSMVITRESAGQAA
jgi:segregation and condensation protein A